MTNTIALLSISVTIITCVITISFFISKISYAVDTLSTGQAKINEEHRREGEKLAENLTQIKEIINTIRISHGIFGEQIKDLSMRIASLEDRMEGTDDDIVRARTRIHILANKLMQIDPQWKGLNVDNS